MDGQTISGIYGTVDPKLNIIASLGFHLNAGRKDRLFGNSGKGEPFEKKFEGSQLKSIMGSDGNPSGIAGISLGSAADSFEIGELGRHRHGEYLRKNETVTSVVFTWSEQLESVEFKTSLGRSLKFGLQEGEEKEEVAISAVEEIVGLKGTHDGKRIASAGLLLDRA